MELPHHKDWLTYFGGTNRPGELNYNFSVKNDQKKMLTSCCFFFNRVPYMQLSHMIPEVNIISRKVRIAGINEPSRVFRLKIASRLA